MLRDRDDEYDDLMDELEAAVATSDCAERGDHVRTVRLKIEHLLRLQMGLLSRLPPPDQRDGATALH